MNAIVLNVIHFFPVLFSTFPSSNHKPHYFSLLQTSNIRLSLFFLMNEEYRAYGDKAMQNGITVLQLLASILNFVM
jgi:hypothetical protein